MTTFKITEVNMAFGTFTVVINYSDNTTEEFTQDFLSLVANKEASSDEIINALKSIVHQREKEKYDYHFTDPDVILNLVGTVHSLE